MKIREKAWEITFLCAAAFSILAVVLICLFLFVNGIPAMKKIGFADFLLGTKWKPGNDLYGIFPMIIGSLYVTAGAIIFGVPIGLMTAIFLSKFCPAKIHRYLKMAIDLLAGIPSVVYGFFGLMVIVPFVRNVFGGNGSSILTASILLGMMILPTIISVSEAAINAVPVSYYEGARALGATHERSVFIATIPAAKSGIMAGIILDNMLCLLIFLQKRGFSLKLGKTNLTKALPKCKKETQHGNYNLCRNGCPQRQLFIMLL